MTGRADSDRYFGNNKSLIDSLIGEMTKTHIILDNSDRPVFIFTASVNAADGTPCLCTEYIYKGAASTIVVGQRERVYEWKTVWETNYTFDPNTDYDLDGDGIL